MIFKIIKKLYYQKKFSNHNKKVYDFSNLKVTNNLILVEFNRWTYLNVVKSYVVYVLKKKFNANVIAYESYTIYKKNSSLENLKKKFLSLFNLGNYGVYNSFGVDRFIEYTPTDKQINKAQNIVKKILLNKKLNKKTILNLKLEKIYIGDLVYDTYLKVYKKETLHISSEDFKNYLKKSIILFIFWNDFIKKNRFKIKKNIIVHSSYLEGLQARICAFYKIDSYRISHKSISKINKYNLYSGNELKKFRKVFSKFSPKKKEKIFNWSKSAINKKLEITNQGIEKLKSFNKQKKIQIVVSCHSFNDAPHAHGKFFFEDFYEWLKFLGKISDETNYRWLIKPHPITYESDMKYLIQLKKKFKKFEILSKNFNNNLIIRKFKPDLALTCQGTIGYEYPFQGIKVINCGKNTPHNFFKFCFTPKDKKDYAKILRNFQNFDYKINKLEIMEYYFLRRKYIYVDFLNLKLIDSDTNGYKLIESFSRENFYERWIKQFKTLNHHKTIQIIQNYFHSNDLILEPNHEKKG